MSPQNFLILGGGISGLTAAWYLAQNAPLTTKITILEASKRFGGWIESTRIGKDKILFEQGPRTLRPFGLGGLVVLDMANKLNLRESIHAIPKNSPAAQNRYIFYPDKLVKLPGSNFFSGMKPILSTRFLLESIPAIIREPFVEKCLEEDESIHSFITRRLNEKIANILISAIVHGIYAGDIKKLSIKSTFTNLYKMEKLYGSILKGSFSKNSFLSTKDLNWIQDINRDNKDLMNTIKNSSLYSFKDGIEQLVLALVEDLKTRSNVELKTLTNVKELKFKEEENEIEIITNNGNFKGDHVISTIPAYELKKLIPVLPHLEYNPFVTVGVVNIAYNRPNLLPVKGFGVLIPQVTPNNPYHVLGIVFDSDAMPLQDYPKTDYTKVTLMLGGHYYYNSLRKEGGEEELLFNEEQLLNHSLQTLENVLGIYATPVEYQVKLQRKCIPQYYVGHHSRIRELHNVIKKEFKNRLSVGGSSYLGVSINDCVVNSAKLALNLLDPKQEMIITGLEDVENV
ncbi:1721_t:CDS:2 [Diversispora eburnea]|uniref:Protoporphyrinogen oxidase n=1 Tax=Diversispora eburnea TaxID=1213867 RepID=A0A9N8VFX8_9GLOM|nr:1721_t:CDS:2 [Diversispora eburnea]